MPELRALQSPFAQDMTTARPDFVTEDRPVSNQDSFIDEVTEEVRKDKLYAAYKRYGWMVALAIVVIVVGAAANEWRKSAAEAKAQAAGDALLTALSNDAPEDRAAALAALDLPGDAGSRAVTLLMQASAATEAGDLDAARTTLDQLAADADMPVRLQQLATLKSVILSAGETSPEDRMARLSQIATPGSPFRLLALEQIALAELESGDADKALETLTGIVADAEVTQDLRTRATQLIVALGGDVSAS